MVLRINFYNSALRSTLTKTLISTTDYLSDNKESFVDEII